MIIGITGGIGSGKSVIAKQLRKMGYSVYDTDSEAKRLIVEDAHVRVQITALFGPEAYKDGVYQTAFVAQQVFADKNLLAKLNAIVHPAVKADIISKFRSLGVLISPKGSNDYSQANVQKFRSSGVIAEPMNSDSGLFFIECAILFQAGFDVLCDKVVAVTAPEDIRLERVIARDHSDMNKVRARMRAQEAEKDLQRADIIINNDGQVAIRTLCEEILQITK